MKNKLKYIPIVVLGLSSPLIAGEYGTKEEKMAKKEMKAKKFAEMTIVEAASSKDKFSTLVAALKAADLVEVLNGEGPFTVFAPTNEAFEALPEGTLDDLLKPENKEKLVEILKFHVVDGKVMSSDLSTTEVDTLLTDEALEVVVNDDEVTIDGAKVKKADIVTSNGVIHVVDSVLLPE